MCNVDLNLCNTRSSQKFQSKRTAARVNSRASQRFSVSRDQHFQQISKHRTFCKKKKKKPTSAHATSVHFREALRVQESERFLFAPINQAQHRHASDAWRASARDY